MAGFSPNVGDAYIAGLIVGQSLELRLFTNTSVSGTDTYGTLTQPTGGGYGPIALTSGNWTGSTGTRTYNAVQSFVVSGTNYNTTVKGYFICVAGTHEVIAIEADANLGSGVQFNVGSSYDITPTLTVN